MPTAIPPRTEYRRGFYSSYIERSHPSAFSPNPANYNAWDDMLAFITFMRLNRGNATAGNRHRPACPNPVLDPVFLDFQRFTPWFYNHIDQADYDNLLYHPTGSLLVRRGLKTPDIDMVTPDGAMLCLTQPHDATRLIEQATARLYRAHTDRSKGSAAEYLLKLLPLTAVCASDAAQATAHLTTLAAAKTNPRKPRNRNPLQVLNTPVQLTLDF